MAEITVDNEGAVRTFINSQFQLNDQVLAADYARIAVFLSDEQKWKPELALLSESLQEEYWARAFYGQSNRLSAAISKVGSHLGFSNYTNGIVMAGFTDPNVFVQYVQKGSFWKDAVSSNHGEYSHSLQWLTLGMAAKEKRLSLYSSISSLFTKSVNYRSKDPFFIPARDQPDRIYLWDFLVDCFDFGPQDPDYTSNIVTHTARSPTHFNTIVQGSDTWIGRHLQGRYAKRNWAAPGSSQPTSIKQYAIDRATAKKYQEKHSNSGGNFVYQHDRLTKVVPGNKRPGPRGGHRGQLAITEGVWGQPGPRKANLYWQTKLGTQLRLEYTGNTTDFKVGTHWVTFDIGEEGGQNITVENLAKAT